MTEKRKCDYFEQSYDEQLEKKRTSFVSGDYAEICTLEEWSYVWLREVLPGVVKQSTRTMYGETMARHILPRLGKTHLKELTASKVSGWLDMLRTDTVPGTVSENMTEGTVRNTLSVLSGCMRDAQKYGFIEKNPCLEPAWVLKPRNLNESRDYLKEDQIAVLDQVFEQCRSKEGYPEGLGFELSLYTGVFLSEAAALKWGDVDLRDEVLHIRYFVVLSRDLEHSGGETSYELEEVMGRKKREVPIPQFFARRLRDIRSQFACGEETFVLDPYRPEPVSLDRMRSVLARKSRQAGLGRVTPQMLRDTYAMRAVHAGASSDVIAELMGFASPRQVVRRYMPGATTDKKELINQMYG